LVLFIGTGLLAVGLARQDGAGSPNAGPARLLELGSVVALLAIGVLVVGAPQPELIATLWQALGTVPGRPPGAPPPSFPPPRGPRCRAPARAPCPAPPPGRRPPVPPQPMQPRERGAPPPAWLAWLVLAGALLMALVVASVMIAVLLMALSAVSRRGMRGSDP